MRDRRYAGIHDSMREGLVDEGLKDVVVVMPGERVKVVLSFTDQPGFTCITATSSSTRIWA